jgi:hypothetical protein
VRDLGEGLGTFPLVRAFSALANPGPYFISTGGVRRRSQRFREVIAGGCGSLSRAVLGVNVISATPRLHPGIVAVLSAQPASGIVPVRKQATDPKGVYSAWIFMHALLSGPGQGQGPA